MAHYVISPAADRDIHSILVGSHERFGPQGRLRYEALLARAIFDVAEDPQRIGSQTRSEIAPAAGPTIFGTAEIAWSLPATAFVARATFCYIELLRMVRWRSGVCSTSVWILLDIFPRTTGPRIPGSKRWNRLSVDVRIAVRSSELFSNFSKWVAECRRNSSLQSLHTGANRVIPAAAARTPKKPP